jgi:hypothetical protein
MRPNDLAARLGISPKTLRAWLRRTYPRADAAHNTGWSLTPDQVQAATTYFGGGRMPSSTINPSSLPSAATPARRGRSSSDEAYVIDLCDEILGQRALRQHRFSFLLGDPGRNGNRVALPVDAYYPALDLVVEYRERQHTEKVAFFDKRQTVSGVGRGEQRRLYDERRAQELPKHGIKLAIISCHDLDADGAGRLRRNREHDLPIIKGLLKLP